MANELAPGMAFAAPAAFTETAREFVGASVRPNTKRAYAAQMRVWEAHCEAEGLAMWPAEPVAVANWLAARAARGQCVSTLRISVAALKAGSEAKGFPFDSKAMPIVRTLRGIVNSAARLPRQAEPLRGGEILDLIAGLGNRPVDVRDAALFAIGYAFALRRSELVGLDLEDLGSGSGVLRVGTEVIEARFAISKTSTGSDGETVVIPRFDNPAAVEAIEAWLALAGVKPSEPVFRSIRKGGAIGARLSAAAVGEIIKGRVRAFLIRRGMSPEKAEATAEKFSGHSLRVGFAVAAAEAGADIRQISVVTRHRSLSMPARYASRADALRSSPHRLRGVGLNRIP